MMVGMVQLIPLGHHYFLLAIPGSEIPVWVSNQSVGDSVTEKLDASNSKLIGFAVCALIVPQENPSAHFGVDHLLSSCEVRLNITWSLSFDMSQIVSDHLLLVVWPPNDRMKDPRHEVTFDFVIYVGNNRCMKRPLCSCMKVKKCGARALYQQDKEELISIMNQSKRSASFYEATDEQEGAMVKATTCGSGGSHYDDEYYSAEE